MNYKLKILFTLFFISFKLYSQGSFILSNLSMEEGLSSNTVFSICEDNNGFLWFATEYGLNRFNGNNFTIYMKSGSEGSTVNDNHIRKVVNHCKENQIWIGTKWEGINVFDVETENFISFVQDDRNQTSLSSNLVTDIRITEEGTVWISTSDAGLNRYNKDEGTFERFNTATLPGLVSDNILSFIQSDDGLFYIGHAGDGLTIWSPESGYIKNYQLTGNDINCLYKDRKGHVWLGTNTGLYLFDPLTDCLYTLRDILEIPETLAFNKIECINQLNDGRIWVGTLCDICFFDPEDIESLLNGKVNFGCMRIRNFQTGLSNPTVLCIYEDAFYNTWVGNNGGGVCFIKHDEPFFRTLKDAAVPGTINGLSDKDASCMCVDENGNLWIGTIGGGINIYKDEENIKIYDFPTDAISSDFYSAALTDSEGNLWFGYHSGIDIYIPQKSSFSCFESQIPLSDVYSLFEDVQKNIWIGTDHGIQCYNLRTGESKIINKFNTTLPSNRIRSISQDRSGNIWIGTLKEGIVVYDPFKNTCRRVYKENGFYSNSIKYIYRDSKDNMWVATEDGLAFFPFGNPDDFEVYNTNKGLACDYIHAVIEDDVGNIWISTNFGISCLHKEDNLILNFDARDGIPVGNFFTGSVAKTTDGMIWFGSQNGVCYFHPESKEIEKNRPPVVFTEFKVFEKQSGNKDILIPVSGKKIVLNDKQRTFSVSFNVMNYALKEQIEYAYTLEGDGDNWFELGYDNQITFRDMPYENHLLKVKARKKNDSWNDNYTMLAIRITPPFWLTWWAKSIYICIFLSFCLFLVLVYKHRLKLRSETLLEKENMRRQQELNEEKLRFFTDITHELRTPLTLILGPLEDLLNESAYSGEQNKKLSLIYQSAKRLLNLVVQILEFRKTETHNRKLYITYGYIEDKLIETGMKYKELNRNTAVRFNICMPAEKRKMYFDAEAITIIADNLLSNAFKYTIEGDISLTVRYIMENNVEYTEIQVYDTGKGISEKDQSHIFQRYYQVKENKQTSGVGIGLALVSNLIELHEATIAIESEEGKGSCFRVRLLTNNTYPEAIHNQPYPVSVPALANTPKPIILVVEDNPDIRNYIVESLEDSYNLLIADDGMRGKELAIENVPDVIISDIRMPLKSGIELCREIKEDIQTCHIPVILLTAKDSLQEKTEGYKAGADSYITKPFSMTLLKSRIINLLDIRQKIANLIVSGHSLKQPDIQDTLNKRDQEFLDKIIERVENNPGDEKVDISSIASQMGMSYSSLFRKIKALTGLSVNEYIRKIRMQKAEKMLLSEMYTISEITYQVGFNSLSYFRECFKEEYGVSPSAYLKQKKSNSE